MGLFSRRNNKSKSRAAAAQAISSIAGLGGNQEDFESNVTDSLSNISEQLTSIGANDGKTVGVASAASSPTDAAMINPAEAEESMMGDNNPASVSSALLKRYKGSCKMKLKNK